MSKEGKFSVDHLDIRGFCDNQGVLLCISDPSRAKSAGPFMEKIIENILSNAQVLHSMGWIGVWLGWLLRNTVPDHVFADWLLREAMMSGRGQSYTLSLVDGTKTLRQSTEDGPSSVVDRYVACDCTTSASSGV